MNVHEVLNVRSGALASKNVLNETFRSSITTYSLEEIRK